MHSDVLEGAMEHIDEGTIHAWLDGALPASEGARVEAHAAVVPVQAAQRVRMQPRALLRREEGHAPSADELRDHVVGHVVMDVRRGARGAGA